MPDALASAQPPAAPSSPPSVARGLRRRALAIAGLWLLYAVPQVSLHGLTCDSPSLFYCGDRTLFWVEHGAPADTLDFDDVNPATGLTRRSPPGFQSRYFPFPDARDPTHYPVFAGLFAALVSQIVAPPGVDPIDGHHLGLVLLHAIGLFWFTLLAGRIFGRRAGLLAGALLLCFPEAIGQSFNNAKDWPCVDFYACAMLAAMEAFLWRRPGSVRRTAIFAGIALSCKMNAVFALLCIDGLGAAVVLAQAWRDRRLAASLAGPFLRRIVGELAAINAIAVFLFLLLWPYLYHGPLATWWPHLREYLRWYAVYGDGKRSTWTNFPLRPLLFATPPLALLCAWYGLGAGLKLRGAARGSFWFTVVWVAFPLLRTAAPHSNFYDGNRHFMEYIPGLCVLAGLGAERLWVWFTETIIPRFPSPAGGGGLGWGGKWGVNLSYAAGLLLLAFGLLMPALRYRPFENTYYNFLIGGLGGAQLYALYDMPEPHDGRVRGTEGDYWYSNLGDGLPRLRKMLQPEQSAMPCGPSPQQIRIMWPEGAQLIHDDPAPGDLLYISPREIFCSFDTVRSLEGIRPVLYRAEREGGLVYEILGPEDGQTHPMVTARSLYAH